jgi:hypothetical protein
MYSVKPIGINTKDNDRDVADGFLQESINMQWRDGAFKPIPERIISNIHGAGYNMIILHKVGDENQINVLGFNTIPIVDGAISADLPAWFGGLTPSTKKLEWFGTILNGVYTENAVVVEIDIVKSPKMSFTILNGLIYFMGDGSTAEEQYYLKLEYNESTGSYIVYDMYAWKSLIPFYPYQSAITITAPANTYQVFSKCGMILVRFALVLKSGEIVLHSPIYGFVLFGLNRSATAIAKDDIIKNIHTFINLDLSFADSALFDQEVSAINVYCSTPYYENKFSVGYSETYSIANMITGADLKGKFREKAEDLFYLVKTIDKPTSTEKLLLTVGSFESDIVLPAETSYAFSRVDINTIAAGEIMPVDNFSYHKVFGKISSYNGRLNVIRPVTVLSGGYIRALSTLDVSSQSGFKINTEDGDLFGISYTTDKSVQIQGTLIITRGLLSYPDFRANLVGVNNGIGINLRMFKCRKNASHNMSCAFDLEYALVLAGIAADPLDATKMEASTDYSISTIYKNALELIAPTAEDVITKYASDNRIQFSQAGEFKVWPAINSYRIGEGKVMNLGAGSVNPSESQIISPIIVGTTDGVYTINLDPNGNNFISSITKTANLPFLSEEILEIDQNILFVSDKGLMVFSDGNITNLTEAYFPQQGDGGFPAPETTYPNYNVLTQAFFGLEGNPYQFDDVVKYLRGAVLAFDSRRNNIWCSNPDYLFSLVYNLDAKQWGMSTMVFDKKMELYSIINTVQEGELYTRYLVQSVGESKLLILSGEDLTKEVFYHILTRPIKFQKTDDYKLLTRMVYRTLLARDAYGSGYFSVGLWGQQDVSRFKKSIPIVAKSDNRPKVYLGNIRYHIPINCRKGKYKSITVLQSGKTLPESYISSFDFDVYLVNNTKMR